MARLSSWAAWLRRATLNPRAWLLFVSLQVPALRALCKYLPDRLLFAIPLYLGVVFLVYVALQQDPLVGRVRVLDSVWMFLALLAVVTIANYLVYPIADGLEAQMRGSDQDDALIQAGQRLFSGLNPYEASTYRGNPISPGPGWVILALPFCMPGIYFLMTPLFILGTAFLLRVLKFVALSGFMCAAIHVLFYYWNPQSYTPLHLLGKGGALLPTGLMIPGVLACVAAGIYTILRSRNRLEAWIFLLWLCLVIPLGVVSLGGLIGRSYDLASWEEANYLMVAAPVCAFYVCLTSAEGERQWQEGIRGLLQPETEDW